MHTRVCVHAHTHTHIYICKMQNITPKARGTGLGDQTPEPQRTGCEASYYK